MTRPAATYLLLALALTALVAVRPARAEQSVPPELRGIDIEERLGAQVPLDTQFVDHTGKRVQLKDYFTNNKPVILTLNYYSCATLCSLVLNGLTDGLRALELEVGKQFQVLTITINPREGTELARGKRAAYLESLGRPVPETGWPFLTGSEKDIERVASASTPPPMRTLPGNRTPPPPSCAPNAILSWRRKAQWISSAPAAMARARSISRPPPPLWWPAQGLWWPNMATATCRRNPAPQMRLARWASMSWSAPKWWSAACHRPGSAS